MNDLPIIKFNPKLPKLTKNEQEVLKLLVEAAELIAPLYLEQEKLLKQTDDFFHNKLNKTKVEKVIRKDPQIISPYTALEWVNKKLIATPYHIKFKDHLKLISDKLNEAALISKDKQFSNFLKLKAKGLLDGSYEASVAAWLKRAPYILDISIGPVVHHDDRLFHAKASYQAWVGVVDTEQTKILNGYKEMILSAQRKGLVPEQRLENYKPVRAKVDDVILLSGHMARTKFVGVNLPMRLDWVEKYGSEVTLFKQVNDLRVKEQIQPTFEKTFESAFKKGFNKEDLRTGNIDYVTLHELAHNYLYYKNAHKNLQDLLAPIYELSATVLGIRMAGLLLLKGVITEKQLESMIIAFICRCYYLIDKSKQNKTWVNYALGGRIIMNFLFENGALKEYKGLTTPNFMKIFVLLQDLLYFLEKLLSSGTRDDAENFIKKYNK